MKSKNKLEKDFNDLNLRIQGKINSAALLMEEASKLAEGMDSEMLVDLERNGEINLSPLRTSIRLIGWRSSSLTC